MKLEHYIKNEDVKLKLFDWSWATTKPEKFNAYNKLLSDFLQKPEVKKLYSKRAVLFYWSLYMGALEAYVIYEDKESLDIVKKCPLTEDELQVLFN